MNGNVLTGLSLVLAYGVFQQGGVWPRDWAICCCALGVLMLLYWLPQRQVHAPAPGRGVLIPVGLLMSVALLQLVPLPLAVINVLSPVRAASLAPLAPVVGPVQVASLSLIPTATLDHVSRLLVYFCLLLTVRDLCWRMRSRLWMVAVPILVVALLEAALGIFQVYSGSAMDVARGTYANRNHFAGLLEIALPLVVMGAVGLWRRRRSPFETTAAFALPPCVLVGLSGLIVLAIALSLSRMGFVAALFALFVAGALSFGAGGRPWRRWAVATVGVATLCGFVFLPSDTLVQRFASLSDTDEISTDTRTQIWIDTLQVVRSFPIIGCGLGAFESALYPHKTTAPLATVDYAHNDYLQYLAELGIIGFLAGLFLASRFLRAALRASVLAGTLPERALGIALTAALAAILLHSFVDFNLYVPANAMLVVWIAGITEGLRFTVRKTARVGATVFVEAEPVHH